MVTQVVLRDTDPEERLRLTWAQSLREFMTFRGVNPKQLRQRLKEDHGIEVTRQAVESWLAGKTAPRPYYQQAIGSVLDMPARTVFPLENLPVRKAS